MNWNKIAAYAILALACLVSTPLQAQVNQQPDSLRFDPETGLPVKAEPEAPAQPQFDPETGELIPPEPVETAAAAVGAPPAFSETALRTMALKNAARNHNTAAWGVGGGLLGCGGMLAGAMGGLIVADEIAGSLEDLVYGLGMGAVVGGVLTAELLARSPTSVSLPAELAGATPQLREQYRQLYRAAARKLKRRSIYGGVAGCAAAAFVLLIL